MPFSIAAPPCPKCGGSTKVVNNFNTENSEEIVRRRKCNDCGHRWYTIQERERPLDSYRIRWRSKDGNKRMIWLRSPIVAD